MTVEDVKAAASDQVTISFDVSGRTKKQVPADWYDQVTEAKDVLQQIKDNYSGREGIIGIGRHAGGGARGNGTPAVVVTLDSDSKKRDERRGELPERTNGIPIEIKERPGQYTADDHGQNDDKCDEVIQDTVGLPGGTGIAETAGTGNEAHFCTNGSRFINGTSRDLLFGWSTAAHCLPSCTAAGQVIYHGSTPIGTVQLLIEERDIAYIERLSDTSPASEMAFPTEPSFSVHISDTVSQSGMATIEGDSSFEVINYGENGCRSEGVLQTYEENFFLFNSTSFCSNTLSDQCVIDYPNRDPPEGGDSGSVYFVEDDSTGNYFAVGQHSGHPDDEDFGFGPQGYSLQNDYDIWWSDI